MALLRAENALNKIKLEGDEQLGVNIVKRALEEPIRMIANNAGWEGSVVVDKVRNNKTYAYGFNAATEQYADLIEDGVIDPTKVVRVALENAASVGALLLTTDCSIHEKKEPKSAAPQMPGGGMGGMDY